MKTSAVIIVLVILMGALSECAPQNRGGVNHNRRTIRRRKPNFPEMSSTTTPQPFFDELLEYIPDDGDDLEEFLSELRKRKQQQHQRIAPVDKSFDPSEIANNPFLQEVAMQQSIMKRPISKPSINPHNPFLSGTTPSPTTRRPTHQFIGFNEERTDLKPEKGNPFFNEQKPSSRFATRRPSPYQDDVFSRFVQTEPKAIQSKPAASRPVATTKKETLGESERLFQEQAKNAKYAFASDVTDDINENNQKREEIRDGSVVKGQYSYSDGYVKITVRYEADDKGYRVIGEDREYIGNGPGYNPDATARVRTYVDGNSVKYQISEDDIIKTARTTGKVNILELLDGDQE